MPVVKLNVSLESQIAATLKRRAADLKMPASRYLSDLIVDEVRRSQDALAAEGYRLLSREVTAFSEQALPAGLESWPEWDESAPIEPADSLTSVPADGKA